MSGMLAASRDAIFDRDQRVTPRCPCCGSVLVSDRIIVDLATNNVIGPLGTIRVQPQSAEVVFKLNERRNRIASDEALYTALWGGINDCYEPCARYLDRVRHAVTAARHGQSFHDGRTGYPGIRTIGLDIVRIRDVGYQLVITG